MFPLQPRDELVFTNPNKSIQLQLQLVDDDLPVLLEDMPTPANNNNLLINFSANPAVVPATRKVLHRDIERKRRQEMSSLYASLRALLPLERIKGKRSVCDHMQEAVTHIDNMHKKIQELRLRRDKLRKAHDNGQRGGGGDSGNRVVLNRAHYGLEILISCSVKSGCSEFGLSRVLAELARGDQLNVFACVSTRTKDCILHQIQAEATVDMASLDLSGLQQRLTNAIDNRM